jgi:hypothetical protein
VPSVSLSDYPAQTASRPSNYVIPLTFAGSLTKSLGSYSGDEFHDLVKNAGAQGAHTRWRKCKHSYDCISIGHFDRAQATIAATPDARYLNSTNTGAFGTIAAVVGDVKEDTDDYKFVKGDDYAFIVYPKTAATSAHWVLEQIDKNGNNYTHSTVDQGTFRECTPGDTDNWASSSGDFLPCGKAPHPVSVPKTMDMTSFGMVKAAVSNLLALFSGGDDTAWFSCASGCCTMET